ncbi:MAG: phosphate regulon sensor histidine kinase PhoR [Burkholderiales bacterium]|nr:phosphate regulon sensor histidine kinase PhoR [Burkholderiales bacterium]
MNHVFRRGLVAPTVATVATLVAWAMAGAEWALLVLAVFAAAIIAFHLWHIRMVTEWATSPLDTLPPRGRGTWAATFSAIYRRVRLRSNYQRDLRAMIQRFRKAAEAIPDGVVVIDEANRIEWANPRASEQLGLHLDRDRGHPIVNLVRQPEFLRYLEIGDYAESVIVETFRGGARRALSLQLVPYGVSEKLLLSRDVTQLEAVARMRRDFIANVSHELKTPLTVVSGFVETMQDLDLDDRQRDRYLGLMADQTRNMRRLVNDLLTLSSLESEHSSVADERFDIAPLLLEVSADARSLSAGMHEIALEIAEPASVVGSREELASAFSNLVSNAIRYTPADGKVTLRWSIDAEGRGVFGVTDTGIGIAAEHLPRLTERFYRVDRSRSRATGGTGLGLAIVKHVLIRHQADLAIESTPGEGSVFSVRLPARRVFRETADPRCTAGATVTT